MRWTVTINRGSAGLSSIFLRSLATCMSTVRDEELQKLQLARGHLDGAAVLLQLGFLEIHDDVTETVDLGVSRAPAVRRSNASTRAISSMNPKGFVT